MGNAFNSGKSDYLKKPTHFPYGESASHSAESSSELEFYLTLNLPLMIPGILLLLTIVYKPNLEGSIQDGSYYGRLETKDRFF